MIKLAVIALLCITGLNAAVSKDVPKETITDSIVIDVKPLPIEVPDLVIPEDDAVPCVIDEDFLQPWPPAEDIEVIVPEEEPENCEDDGEGELTLPNPLPVPELLPIETDPVEEESDVVYAPEGDELPYFADEDGNLIYKDPTAEEDVLCEIPSDYLKPLPIVPDDALPVVAPR